MQTIRTSILKTHAAFLLVASIGGMIMDSAGSFLGRGPEASVNAVTPYIGVGFFEAHGLALILGVVLWRAPVARYWHWVAMSVAVLLGTANLAFWPIFTTIGILPMGYITTAAHALFAGLQLYAAVESAKPVAGSAGQALDATRSPGTGGLSQTSRGV